MFVGSICRIRLQHCVCVVHLLMCVHYFVSVKGNGKQKGGMAKKRKKEKKKESCLFEHYLRFEIKWNIKKPHMRKIKNNCIRNSKRNKSQMDASLFIANALNIHRSTIVVHNSCSIHITIQFCDFGDIKTIFHLNLLSLVILGHVFVWYVKYTISDEY